MTTMLFSFFSVVPKMAAYTRGVKLIWTALCVVLLWFANYISAEPARHRNHYNYRPPAEADNSLGAGGHLTPPGG